MSRPEVDTLKSRKDAVLWLWKTHNEVNARLADIEKKYGHSSSGDPKFPKIQWPDAVACPACKKAGSGAAKGDSWDEHQVRAWHSNADGSAIVWNFKGCWTQFPC